MIDGPPPSFGSILAPKVCDVHLELDTSHRRTVHVIAIVSMLFYTFYRRFCGVFQGVYCAASFAFLARRLFILKAGGFGSFRLRLRYRLHSCGTS